MYDFSPLLSISYYLSITYVFIVNLHYLPLPCIDNYSHHNTVNQVNFILVLLLYYLGHFTDVGCTPCFYLLPSVFILRLFDHI